MAASYTASMTRSSRSSRDNSRLQVHKIRRNGPGLASKPRSIAQSICHGKVDGIAATGATPKRIYKPDREG
jgi:hypothetical protein